MTSAHSQYRTRATAVWRQVIQCIISAPYLTELQSLDIYFPRWYIYVVYVVQRPQFEKYVHST